MHVLATAEMHDSKLWLGAIAVFERKGVSRTLQAHASTQDRQQWFDWQHVRRLWSPSALGCVTWHTGTVEGCISCKPTIACKASCNTQNVSAYSHQDCLYEGLLGELWPEHLLSSATLSHTMQFHNLQKAAASRPDPDTTAAHQDCSPVSDLIA